MANEIKQSSDLWDLELHLTQRRKEIDRKYDFRGSRLTNVLTTLLWLCLLDAGRADRIANSLAGIRNEYRAVLGAGLLAVVLAFVAAIHATRWWYIAVVCSLVTLAAFTYALSR